MSLLSSNEPLVFNLLSLGQRGVGKTVFLAGSYAAFKANQTAEKREPLMLECLEGRDQSNLEAILGYIAQTGKYPPPTMKITDFNFNVKQRNPLGGMTTLCQFRWWDIPGEYTTFDHPDFQKMVLGSHSCCVFINASRLVKDSEYRHELQGIIKQVVAISSLVDPKKIKYSFALIFTQCDLLDAGPIGRLQIEQYLQPLNTALKSTNANCQRFYSSIPILFEQGSYHLQPSGASDAFLWLVSELLNSHGQRPLGMALKQDSSPQEKVISRANRSLLILAGISLGLLGLTAAFLFAVGILPPGKEKITAKDPQVRQYLRDLQENPQDFDTLVALANKYIELGQLQDAIPIMEKIVQQKPQELDWRLNLARLYELNEQFPEAEQEYDQILAVDKNHFKALLSKALLRKQQGDNTKAQQLFKQAEAVAPSNEIKQKIRAMAQQ